MSVANKSPLSKQLGQKCCHKQSYILLNIMKKIRQNSRILCSFFYFFAIEFYADLCTFK